MQEYITECRKLIPVPLRSSSGVVYWGRYRGVRYAFIDWKHWCAYIEVPEFIVSKLLGESIVHGGFTYGYYADDDRGRHFPSIIGIPDPVEGNWVLGWDYAHAGDELVRYTDHSIRRDVFDAIDWLKVELDYYGPREADDEDIGSSRGPGRERLDRCEAEGGTLHHPCAGRDGLARW